MLIAAVLLVFLAGLVIGIWGTYWYEAGVTDRLTPNDAGPDSMPTLMIEEGRTVVLPRGVPAPWKGLVIVSVPVGSVTPDKRSAVMVRPEDFNG